MGIFFRLLAPKPVRRAKRTVGRAGNPITTLSPKPVKRAKRAAWTAANPVEATKFAAENAVVNATRGRSRARPSTRQPQGEFPPAWHPDPNGLARWRWWDGSRWTEHTAD
jgi:hypothetical protein